LVITCYRATASYQKKCLGGSDLKYIYIFTVYNYHTTTTIIQIHTLTTTKTTYTTTTTNTTASTTTTDILSLQPLQSSNPLLLLPGRNLTYFFTRTSSALSGCT
jgi:hypothetical protein